MSTRGVIARKTETGFTGRYHHWDSYPTALGKTLYDMYVSYPLLYGEDMLTTLIDNHPAGWSTINGVDWNYPAGYAEGFQLRGKNNPQCYCHGDRHDEEFLVDETNASGCGCEWAYVFDGDTMYILASYHSDGEKMIGMFGMGDPNAEWKVVAEVDLNGPEPDWQAIHDIAE